MHIGNASAKANGPTRPSYARQSFGLIGKEKAIARKASADNRGKMSKESLKGNRVKLG